MVVLIGFGVDHDGVVDSGSFHAFEEVLRGGGFGGTVGGAFVVGKSCVLYSGKAVQMGVNPGFIVWFGGSVGFQVCDPCRAGHGGGGCQGAGFEEVSSVHNGMCLKLAGCTFPARENNLAILISPRLMIDCFWKVSSIFQHQPNVNLPGGGIVEGGSVSFASVLAG